ncbi:hypothetical protein OIY81_1733 [Cryptosporidium canis]|uniref:Elongin-C n=1 Tax=Cryptosporidium canis TaxID=195482 RepID=A0ABQ8P987_9CRYT|nr:hypothetical protein OIY81_1733 [Cryptosporidium canis]KAJ1613319.1 hypothetical protein OJ252_1009 [Cryptosporidium canis]
MPKRIFCSYSNKEIVPKDAKIEKSISRQSINSCEVGKYVQDCLGNLITRNFKGINMAENSQNERYLNLISLDGQTFQLSSELAEYITNIKDELFRNGSMKFDYINSSQMKKVIEYLEYRHKYSSKHRQIESFQVDESQAIDLLVIADKLGI